MAINAVGTRYLSLVPTQNMIAATDTESDSAVPTSVSPAMSKIGMPAITPGMTKPRQKVFTSDCQRANHAARQMTTTIRASSEG